MVTLESKGSLKGWKYPIHTSMDDKSVVSALIEAGVEKELLRSDDPSKMQLFDFLAHREIASKHPFHSNRVGIHIITKIEKEEEGISMEHSEVISIPFKPNHDHSVSS